MSIELIPLKLKFAPLSDEGEEDPTVVDSPDLDDDEDDDDDDALVPGKDDDDVEAPEQ